jgi:hypothetical protein
MIHQLYHAKSDVVMVTTSERKKNLKGGQPVFFLKRTFFET